MKPRYLFLLPSLFGLFSCVQNNHSGSDIDSSARVNPETLLEREGTHLKDAEMSNDENEPLVLRFTFTYRDGDIELVSSQRVDMTLPANSRSTAREGALPEFWYELRDAQDEVVYRFAAPNPIPTDTEVFSDDPDRTIERIPVPPKEGVFTVLMPEIEGAQEILLMRSETSRVAETTAVVEIARFKLTDDAND